MNLVRLLQVVVLLITALVGVVAFIRPRSVTGFIGLTADGVRGVSELRSIFGGLLIGMGIAPLLVDSVDAYQVVGIAYLAIAITRTFSTFYDRSYSQSNLISLGIEWVSGVVLMIVP